MQFLLLVAVLLAQCLLAIPLPAYLDTATRQFISMPQVTQRMTQHSFIFVGEFHNHIAGHAMELDLLKNYFSNISAPQDFAMSLEMFERDVQFLVNGYMQNEIPESFFLANSRPWSNYMTDYRALVQYVKSIATSKRQVLASNIPRRFAAVVADGNETLLWELPAMEQSYYAPQIYAPHDQYYKIFYNMFKEQGWSDDKIERYYRAQCIKDDTMAMSIVQWYKNATQPARLISYTGSFHVDYKLGTFARVQMALPQVSKLLISIVSWNEKDAIKPEDFDGLADIVIFAKENPESI